MVSINAEQIQAEHMDGQVARTMLEQSPECIKVIDPKGRLCFMSENGLELMEIGDFDKVRGALWWDLWPEAARDTLRNAISAAARGVSVVFEAACPTAGGNLKHWSVRVSRVQGGDLDGMIVAASQDVTDRVETEAAARKLQNDNAALRRFTRFVAHDLRGPIRHQKILAELIAETVDPDTGEEASELAREIEGSAEGMLDLLSGLEALHAPEGEVARPEPLSLSDLVTEVTALFDARRVRPACTPDAARQMLLVDRGQFASILVNLFENAAKYRAGTAPAQVTVAVEQDAAAGFARLLVMDDGPGFGPDRFDDLFEPLVRQSNSVDIEGSGIGLALVRRLVELQGGRIVALPARPDGASGAALRIDLPIPVTKH